MKIILTGGGTGGHVLPAVAIAEKLYEKYPDAEILFIGRLGGGENRTVKDLKIPIKEIKVCGIERKLTFKNIKSIYLALRATAKAKKIIKEFSPDAVIGTGGYVCFPVLRAAQRLGIKTLIHESNAFAGLVTRLCADKCDAVLLNHAETKKHLKSTSRCHVVGNPLRKSFFETTREAARKSLGINKDEVLIVSFGGSGGSRALNEHALRFMDEYSRKTPGVRHIHATGEKYYELLPNEIKNNRSGGGKILPYITNMPTLLSGADIVICRCGAMTLSEIAITKSAAVLIPSPNVADNHQYKNARLLSSCGAAVMIEEKELSYETFSKKVIRLVENESERKKLSKCIQRFAKSDAACRIVDIIDGLVRKQHV